MFELIISYTSRNRVGSWLNNLYWMEVVVELQLFNSFGPGSLISTDQVIELINPLERTQVSYFKRPLLEPNLKHICTLEAY